MSKPLSNTKKSSVISSAPLRGDDVDEKILAKADRILDETTDALRKKDIYLVTDKKLCWHFPMIPQPNLKGALSWAKSWRYLPQQFVDVCQKCGKRNIGVYHKDDDEKEPILCMDCLLNRTFGEAIE